MGDSPVVVLDNGAYTAKVGLSNFDDPVIMPNCIMKAKAERRRAFIGNQIDECRDASGLFYLLCFQKGFLLNWDIQKSVWDYIFSTEGVGFTLENRPIIITEPQLNFPGIQEAMMEILFEEFRCSSVLRTTTAKLAAYNYSLESEEGPFTGLNCIIVDVGYSFTHIVPYVLGERVSRGIRRIEVGGKVLTNYLKEVISYRYLNLMDETYVVNQIKEDICFVSQNFNEDMLVHRYEEKRKELMVDYVLPDFTTVRRGYIRKPDVNKKPGTTDRDQQSLHLCNERFTVPELLFNPSDVGIMQMGIPETIMDALKDCPEEAHWDLLRNILIIGGSSLFPNFGPRLKTELRALAPDDMEVCLISPIEPISYAWDGGKEFANSEIYKNDVITRGQYEDTGFIFDPRD